MVKRFNVLVYYISSLIRIIDSELCFRFNDNKNRDSGLPPELEDLDIEYYYKLAKRIRTFKREIKNNQDSILRLSSKDLNHLNIYRLKHYSQQTEKYKGWRKIGSYEIRDNILVCKTFYNLYFFTRKIWRNETCIHFWVEDGVIKQKKRVIYKLNQEYNNDEYKEVFDIQQSKLINFIFLPDHRMGRSIRKLDPDTADIIRKIKAIEVIENKLVIIG